MVLLLCNFLDTTFYTKICSVPNKMEEHDDNSVLIRSKPMSNFNHGFSADAQGRGNILTTPVLIFLVLSTIDIGFNAAAGVAAVAAGAHANGSPLTDRAKGIGALAAVTKSGLLAFVGFLGFANLNIAAWMVLLIAGSVFGIAILVTLQVANTVLGESESFCFDILVKLIHRPRAINGKLRLPN